MRLRKHAQTLSGKLAYCVQAFADALEVGSQGPAVRAAWTAASDIPVDALLRRPAGVTPGDPLHARGERGPEPDRHRHRAAQPARGGGDLRGHQRAQGEHETAAACKGHRRARVGRPADRGMAEGPMLVGATLQGTVSNILEENVVQPLLVSLSAIQLSAETVRMMMKIDDIVRARGAHGARPRPPLSDPRARGGSPGGRALHRWRFCKKAHCDPLLERNKTPTGIPPPFVPPPPTRSLPGSCEAN